MEQVEGGDLIVNKGEESRPKEGDTLREMNAVDGYEAAYKLAQVRGDIYPCSLFTHGTILGRVDRYHEERQASAIEGGSRQS